MTTASIMPSSLLSNTNVFPFSILPLLNKFLFAISVRTNELSCSVNKTEQFYAEIVMFQFTWQTNLP
ncbi:sumo-activating enzyme 2 [Corchorus olitorius]|uniref:Sumo-activating enzyme 2 n=1 Tax=Corchorus olitorius TaxID=93759 RepID=A0A1R3G1Y4_9ROSI|nr:sumo-activating enzyme 2 [Corchorus olitorius]